MDSKFLDLELIKDSMLTSDIAKIIRHAFNLLSADRTR